MNSSHMLINTLGLSLGINIHYITSCYIKSKSSKQDFAFVIISSSSLIFYSKIFNTIKGKIDFNQIEHFFIDAQTLMIKIINRIEIIKILTSDIISLHKALNCYYKVYHYEILGNIYNVNFNDNNNDKDSLIINHPQASNEYKTYQHSSGYQFFILNKSIVEGIGNSLQIITDCIKINISIEDIKEINDNPHYDNKFIQTQVGIINKYMQKNYHIYKLLQYSSYNKKLNLDNDNAIWDCIRVDYVCQEHHDDIEDNYIKIKRKEFHCSFIIMRRKYIPPLYDTFQDIMIYITEPSYCQFLNNKLSNEANKALETIADSFQYATKGYFNHLEYDILLQRQFDGLLLDEDTFNYFIEVLNIKGINSYIFGLKYCYKLLSYCNELLHYNILKEDLQKNIIKYETGSSCLYYHHDLLTRLDNCTLESIIKDFSHSFINTHSMSDYYMAYKIRWEFKIWIFLGHCINNIMKPLFDYEELIHCYFQTINKEKKEIIYQELINLLYLKIYDKDNININLNNFTKTKGCLANDTITRIEYNENLLYISIKTLLIDEVIKNRNDLCYVFRFLIDNKCTKDLLQAIIIMIKQLIYLIHSDKDESIDSYAIIIPSLLSIYSMNKTSFIEANEACRCLIHMSSIKIINSVNPLAFLIIQSPFFWQSIYLSIHYEKLLFNSLRLFNNILQYYSLDQLYIKELLQSNKSTISALIFLIKGTGLNKVYFDILTIKTLIIIMTNLLKIIPLMMHELLCNGDIYQHLLYYLHNLEGKIGKWSNVDLIELQESILKLLYYFFTPNTPQLNKYAISLENIINKICQDNLHFILNYQYSNEDNMKTHENKLRLSMLEMLMKFSLKIMTQDELLIIKLKKDKDSCFITVLNILKRIKEEMIDNNYHNNNTIQTTLDVTKNESDINLSRIHNESIMDNVSRLDISFINHAENEGNDSHCHNINNKESLDNNNQSNSAFIIPNPNKENKTQRKFKLRKK